MKQKLIKVFLKKCLGDAVENMFVFSFILLVFFFLHWISSFIGEPSIPMVILVTFIVFIFGAKPMKVHLAGERLNLMIRHYINILFP